jgi:hypothetical protein
MKVIHEKYYVYLLTVQKKLTYYGVTSNFETRKKEHIRDVSSLIKYDKFTSIPIGAKGLNVHHKIAKYLMKSKLNRTTCGMNFSICYTSDNIADAKEVELFLIKKSIKSKNNCNVKTTH